MLSLRQKEKIKVRQPLQTIMIPVLSDAQKEDILAVSWDGHIVKLVIVV